MRSNSKASRAISGHAFVFTVEGTQGIDLVQSSPEFTSFMRMNTGRAAPLLEAVLKFHHAQNLSLWVD
jgi:hypothetical protein